MKQADTLFRHKSRFADELSVAFKEIFTAITALTKKPSIDLVDYVNLGVCDRVGSWIMDNDGESGVFGTFVSVYRKPGKEEIFLLASGYDSERDEDTYDYTLDELVYLYDELEKILHYEQYQFSMKRMPKE